MVCRSTPGDTTRWIGLLDEAVEQPSSLISIHAAESLIRLQQGPRLVPYFRAQLKEEASPYQMGVWRVLAKIEDQDTLRESATRRIRDTLLNESSAYRVHAMESLAKIRAPILPEEKETVRRVAMSDSDTGAPFALWRLAHTKAKDDAIARLTDLLNSENEVTRARAAYTLWHLRPLPETTIATLEARLADGTLPDQHRLMFALAAGNRSVWEPFADSDVASARYFVAIQLAEHQDEKACILLRQLLKDPDLDVRSTAAFALLKQNGETP